MVCKQLGKQGCVTRYQRSIRSHNSEDWFPYVQEEGWEWGPCSSFKVNALVCRALILGMSRMCLQCLFVRFRDDTWVVLGIDPPHGILILHVRRGTPAISPTSIRTNSR